MELPTNRGLRGLCFKTVSRVGVLAVVLSTAYATLAQPVVQPVRTILNPVPAVADNFGRNISATMNGLILCGAAGSEVGGEEFNNSGVAYLINPATGAVAVTMLSPEPEENVGFGAFSWSGITKVVVSSLAKSDNGTTSSGRAYVYDMATGQHTRTLFNPTPGDTDRFGYGVGMLGDTAIIGTPSDDGAGLDAGSVDLFNTETGALIRTILNPDPTTQDNFGYSVAGIGTDKILVGAPVSDVGTTDSGVAYLINANTGQVIHKLINPEPREPGYFGFQVRAHGEDLLVGSPFNNKAYLFDGETGQLLLTLANPDAEPGFFGSTVGSIGPHILVGNPLTPFEDEWIGRAYLFNGLSGALMQTFENPTPGYKDRFGVGVAGVDGQIVISADQDSSAGVQFAGSIYIYDGPKSAVCADWTLFQ